MNPSKIPLRDTFTRRKSGGNSDALQTADVEDPVFHFTMKSKGGHSLRSKFSPIKPNSMILDTIGTFQNDAGRERGDN